MKTTRVGGGHPFYRVVEDVREDGGPRASAQQDIWHYTFAKMVDACAAYGIKAFYGPFGDIADLEGCEQQFRNAFLLGCVGAWSLHPSQIAVAKRVFSPDPAEVKVRLYSEALTTRDAGDLATAKARLQSLLQMSPNDAGVLRLLGAVEAALAAPPPPPPDRPRTDGAARRRSSIR